MSAADAKETYARIVRCRINRAERQPMKEHEYIKVIDRVHITSAIEQLNKVRPAASIGGLREDDLKSMVAKLREWEEELFRVIDVDPDSS